MNELELVEAEAGEASAEMLKRIMFSNLTEKKIDVRMKCPQCDGRGVKHGDECELCDGDKTVVQSMSVYNILKEGMPFILHELKGLAMSMAEAQAGR